MPPFLLMHGSKDEDVPYEQSVEMCDKMKRAGAPCDLITIEGAPHGMDHWESHAEWLWYKKALVEWLKQDACASVQPRKTIRLANRSEWMLMACFARNRDEG